MTAAAPLCESHMSASTEEKTSSGAARGIAAPSTRAPSTCEWLSSPAATRSRFHQSVTVVSTGPGWHVCRQSSSFGSPACPVYRAIAASGRCSDSRPMSMNPMPLWRASLAARRHEDAWVLSNVVALARISWASASGSGLVCREQPGSGMGAPSSVTELGRKPERSRCCVI
eukprot:5444754-Prymnesium_polylepis.1